MTASPSLLPPQPRRYLALWFPFLPTDRWQLTARRRGDAPAEPLVLVEPIAGALRLAAVSRKALTLGLRPGLPLADARARIPELATAVHDPEADAALLGRMAEACDRWTPLVALDPVDGLLLDVTGCDHLFGGEVSLREETARRFRQGGFAVRAVIAGTPDAAHALARFGKSTVVPPGGDEAATRPLPIRALDLEPETRAALSGAGLRWIAELADLPSRPLAARFGQDLSVRLSRVLGREDRRITPLRQPLAHHLEQTFAEPIAHAEAIAATLGDLIVRIMERLTNAGCGGRAFEASFFRTDGAVRRIRVETGRPSRDPGIVLRLLRARLDALTDPLDPGYGFDLVRLAVPVAEPLASLQLALDGKAADEDDVSDLVDRLVARFGACHVLRFSTIDTHEPVRTSRLVPASAVAALGRQWERPERGEPPLRPFQLFDPPQAIDAIAEVPDGPPHRFRWRCALHTVVHAEGPERIATEWWRQPEAATRDYYRVEDSDGYRFWLFRDGLYGRETRRPRWFLHGLFA